MPSGRLNGRVFAPSTADASFTHPAVPAASNDHRGYHAVLARDRATDLLSLAALQSEARCRGLVESGRVRHPAGSRGGVVDSERTAPAAWVVLPRRETDRVRASLSRKNG